MLRLSGMAKSIRYRTLYVLLGLFLAAVIVVGVCSFSASPGLLNGKHFTGSQACIDLVKKREGDNFKKIYNLTCTLEPRAIGNSTLGAQYFSYGGTPKDRSNCNLDVADNWNNYCPVGAGVVLSDGRTYDGIGVDDPKALNMQPTAYDYCYSSLLPDAPLPKPTSKDLYFYKGQLYDRVVYKNVIRKTSFGNCILNGTSLSRGSSRLITNVTVGYKNFPTSCASFMIGKKIDTSQACSEILTAAQASLTECYSNSQPVQEHGIITSYKVQPGSYLNGDCESVYVQRMAALDRCQSIVDAKLRAECRPKVLQPSSTVTRVRCTL